MNARPSLRLRSFVARREDEGSRVDRFLVSAFACEGEAVSRSQLQLWIDRGRVTTHGRARKASDKVRAGDVVNVEPEGPPLSTAEPDARVPFDVMHVNDAVVVVNKPAGVVVHPARGHATGTLVNGLLALGLFDASVLEGDERDAAGHARPGIVHRLDKGTSGVMVVARTGAAREALKAQFHAHTIGREYVALCAGEVSEGTIATLHGRHPTDRLRFTTRVKTGKRAVTHVRVIERFDGATYVACTLETGRTHQIRVHLAESGTPVIGDALYAKGAKGGKASQGERVRAVAEALGHQALHARLLAFVHPESGERVTFEAQAPADFTAALEALRTGSPTGA